MAEIATIEEPMSHGDDAPIGGVALTGQRITVNEEEESVVNDDDIPNTDKEPGDCVMLQSTTKTLLKEMVDVAWPMKYAAKINWCAARKQFDLPESFVFNPESHKTNVVRHLLCCVGIVRE